MNFERRGVVILSGGIDSSVLLYYLQYGEDTVRALTVDYGQRNRRELIAASEIAAHLKVPHQIIRVSGMREILGGSSQTDMRVAVPHGEPSDRTMQDTIVPNRNMILLSLAGAWAYSTGASFVAYGPHAGDAEVYPDCRPAFVQAAAAALQAATGRVTLRAPFLGHTKKEIIRVGQNLGVPFHLTWSCYDDLGKHCGQCGACRGRQAAFREAEVEDPTEYLT